MNSNLCINSADGRLLQLLGACLAAKSNEVSYWILIWFQKTIISSKTLKNELKNILVKT
jgi:hypothetical protein